MPQEAHLEQDLDPSGALVRHDHGAPVAALRLLLCDQLPQNHAVAESVRLQGQCAQVYLRVGVGM